MNIEKLARSWLPPKIAWHVLRPWQKRRDLERFAMFYRKFAGPGGLCFDVGANLGERTRAFRQIGCRVVAVEPQSRCFAKLQKDFGKDPEVVLLKAALGHKAGEAELKIAANLVLSTLSDAFIQRTSSSGRFAAENWASSEIVEIRTLDQLIDEHGVPDFIKIDVEGHESEVLAGLSLAVPAVAIEWTPEFSENALASLDRLDALGDYEYQLSWGESMRFSREKWRSPESIRAVIGEFEGEIQLFGDIYARLQAGGTANGPARPD